MCCLNVLIWNVPIEKNAYRKDINLWMISWVKKKWLLFRFGCSNRVPQKITIENHTILTKNWLGPNLLKKKNIYLKKYTIEWPLMSLSLVFWSLLFWVGDCRQGVTRKLSMIIDWGSGWRYPKVASPRRQSGRVPDHWSRSPTVENGARSFNRDPICLHLIPYL